MLLVSLFMLLSVVAVSADTGSSVAKLTGEIFGIVIVFLPLGILFVFLYYLSDIIPFLKRFIPF